VNEASDSDQPEGDIDPGYDSEASSLLQSRYDIPDIPQDINEQDSHRRECRFIRDRLKVDSKAYKTATDLLNQYPSTWGGGDKRFVSELNSEYAKNPEKLENPESAESIKSKIAKENYGNDTVIKQVSRSIEESKERSKIAGFEPSPSPDGSVNWDNSEQLREEYAFNTNKPKDYYKNTAISSDSSANPAGSNSESEANGSETVTEGVVTSPALSEDLYSASPPRPRHTGVNAETDNISSEANSNETVTEEVVTSSSEPALGETSSMDRGDTYKRKRSLSV